MAPGALAASLLLAALVVLAPGQARAANECGTPSGTPRTATCTATSYANGIQYLNQQGLTLSVPGAATAWAVSTGTGNNGSGIVLDSVDLGVGDSTTQNLALTVGGASASANQVAITMRASPPANAGWNNHGIFVNQQGRGTSSTTVTTHAGVTIGASSSARMNRSGIHADVWLGTGAASVTNAATIYSTGAGIYLQRGGDADTTNGTTLTNSGAVTAANIGLQLRYFAGDATNTGNAKIDNTGAIVKDASGWSGAIDLEYQGTGDAEVDNKGTVTATHDSAATPVALTSGYGIRLRYLPNSGASVTGSGTATIKNTHAVMSTHDVLRLESTGLGAATIENSGALTATGTSGLRRGIMVNHGGVTTAATTMVVTVTNSGAITADEGIFARVHNKNIAGDDVGIFITHSGGAIVTTGRGIRGTIGDLDDTAANNTGDITIAVTGGSVQSGSNSLEVYSGQSGGVDIDVSSDVTLTSTAGIGMFVQLPSTNTVGSIDIDNAGAITALTDGIYVRRSASTATSAISVTNSGDIEKSGTNIDRDGIVVEELSVGAVTVDNSGDIGDAAATAMYARGIRVVHTGAGGGDVTITNSGDIVADAAGIRVVKEGTSGLISVTTTGGSITADTGIHIQDTAVHTGAVTVSVGGDITAEEYGIHVEKAGTAGDIGITTTGGSITAENEHGIYPVDNADHTGTVTIRNAGDVTAERSGIYVARLGSGAVSVTSSGGTVMGETEPGILARNKLGDASDVTVAVSGGTVRANGRSSPAIHTHQHGTGDLAVTVSEGATLISKQNAGLFASLGNGDRVQVTQGGAVLGRTGVRVQVTASATADPAAARAAQPVIDIDWSGSFAAGTTAQTAPDDNDRFEATTAAVAVGLAQTVVTEQTIRYGSPAGIEAQVMSWRDVMTEVAKGDDPDPFADLAAQQAAVPTGATASDNAYVAQFRAALGNGDIEVAAAVFDAINTGATSLDDITDAEIVTYLQTDDGATRTLLRNILAESFTDKEKAVLRAVVTNTGLDAALDDADAGFDGDYKTAVRALLARYNVGNIGVTMSEGSIDSRGDGIRAYYATPNANNGAISVTIAAGTTVTGGMAGIYVANAGPGLRIPKMYAPKAIRDLASNRELGEDALVAMGELNDDGDAIAEPWLDQLVTVYGTVTGGEDAAVHLSGGGAVLVLEGGKVHAGSSGMGILVNDPGPAHVYIDGEVKGAAGGDAAVHLTGGGSVTVGLTGRVEANGAGHAIQGGADAASEVDVVLAVADLYRESVVAALGRVDGTTAGVASETVREYRDGVPSGYRALMRNAAGEPNLSGFEERSEPPTEMPRGPGEMPTGPGEMPTGPGEMPTGPGEMPTGPPVLFFSCADASAGLYGRCHSEPNDGNDISVTIAEGENIAGDRAGVQADFAGTPDAGGISVTVAKGASVMARGGILTRDGIDGIYVANAGEGLRIPKKYAPRAIRNLAANRGLGEDALVTMGTLNAAGDAIARPWLNQLVTVEGTVTGGAGAAVHLDGGGTVLVLEGGKVHAGSSGVAILVNDPGPAYAYIDGTVTGGDGGAAAVHLTGGGSAIVGLNGKVEANGATRSISGGEDAASEVDLVYAIASQAREDVQAAHDRVVGGTAGVRESYQEYRNGVPMGYAGDVKRNPTTGELDLSGFEPRDPGEGPAAPTFTFDCASAGDGRCRLYEALPSMLVAMNGLPSYAERMSAARDGNGAWARVETARGKWQAKKATTTAGELAYDHSRNAGRAGMDFAVREDVRLGVSVHALGGEGEMAGVGEVKLDGLGAGVSATWLSGGLYVDAQAAATWYDVNVKSNIHGKLLKKGASGAGYALGVDVGRRMPLGGLFVTPRAGFAWSQVDFLDFMDMETAGGARAQVSVEDAGSMTGRLGVMLETETGMGERTGRLFGSLDVEQEFADETEVKVGGETLKTEVRPTAVRLGLGGVFHMDENMMVRATGGYQTSGSGTSGYGGGLELRVQF